VGHCPPPLTSADHHLGVFRRKRAWAMGKAAHVRFLFPKNLIYYRTGTGTNGTVKDNSLVWFIILKIKIKTWAGMPRLFFSGTGASQKWSYALKS
jgi:hypothetical protein